MAATLNVPHMKQTNEWPSGDECLCAVMLLRHLGIRMHVDEFIDFFLPQSQMKRREGQLIGPDPNEKFAGSPYEKGAFGCYPGALVKALNDCFYVKGLSYKAEDATGMKTDELLAEGVGKGVPVIYWASEEMRPTHPGFSWICKTDGHPVQWIDGTQCMLLIGGDENELVFNDPLEPEGAIHYSRNTAVRRHKELDKRAVIVRKNQS